MVRLSLLWGLGLVLIPLAAVQGWWVRRNALRLGAAMGPLDGTADAVTQHSSMSVTAGGDRVAEQSGEQPPLRILGLGDSVIAGVGIETTAESLVPQVAFRWSQSSHRRVAWSIVGEDGATSADLPRLLDGTNQSAYDAIVISVGVNDVTRLTSLVRWQSALMALIERLKMQSPDARLVFLMLPPMGQFPMLPQPLRGLLGVRAAMLNRVLGWVIAAHERVIGVDLEPDFDPSRLARDGYHPNSQAITQIAGVVEASL